MMYAAESTKKIRTEKRAISVLGKKFITIIE